MTLILTIILACKTSYPLGENGVYIPGEACMVNTTGNITIEELQDLLDGCEIYHSMYLKNEL